MVDQLPKIAARMITGSPWMAWLWWKIPDNNDDVCASRGHPFNPKYPPRPSSISHKLYRMAVVYFFRLRIHCWITSIFIYATMLALDAPNNFIKVKLKYIKQVFYFSSIFEQIFWRISIKSLQIKSYYFVRMS